MSKYQKTKHTHPFCHNAIPEWEPPLPTQPGNPYVLFFKMYGKMSFGTNALILNSAFKLAVICLSCFFFWEHSLYRSTCHHTVCWIWICCCNKQRWLWEPEHIFGKHRHREKLESREIERGSWAEMWSCDNSTCSLHLNDWITGYNEMQV